MRFEDVYTLFFYPGEVCEIRAYGLSGKNSAWEGFARGAGIVFGYFDNAQAFGKCAEALEAAKAPGIYFTLNPAIPDLLARAANRLKAADQKTAATSDKEIRCIRWLPIDLDPKRPTNISSSDDELERSWKLRNEISKWLVDELKAVTGIPAISGNGAHLVLRLPDLPVTEENTERIKKCLHAIHHKFKNDHVDVDLKVFNPSRIWKLYGTTARKGDHIPARPHRKSYIHQKFLDAPE